MGTYQLLPCCVVQCYIWVCVVEFYIYENSVVPQRGFFYKPSVLRFTGILIIQIQSAQFYSSVMCALP